MFQIQLLDETFNHKTTSKFDQLILENGIVKDEFQETGGSAVRGRESVSQSTGLYHSKWRWVLLDTGCRADCRNGALPSTQTIENLLNARLPWEAGPLKSERRYFVYRYQQGYSQTPPRRRFNFIKVNTPVLMGMSFPFSSLCLT